MDALNDGWMMVTRRDFDACKMQVKIESGWVCQVMGMGMGLGSRWEGEREKREKIKNKNGNGGLQRRVR